jgi:hypothetical protein
LRPGGRGDEAVVVEVRRKMERRDWEECIMNVFKRTSGE